MKAKIPRRLITYVCVYIHENRYVLVHRCVYMYICVYRYIFVHRYVYVFMHECTNSSYYAILNY